MRKSKSLLTLVFFFIFFSVATKSVSAATYYVAANGSDSNPGTITQPFRTIQKAVNSTNAGDITLVRSGTYHEAITITKSGTSSSPITISGYPGEKPVIDGQYSLPTGPIGLCDPVSGNCHNWNPLISIEGNYVTVDNFELKRSKGRGVRIWPNDYNTVKNLWVHDIRASAILVQDSDNNLIENNKVWLAGNFAPYPRSASTLNWPGGVALQRSKNTVIRGNEVFNVWGEGIIPMNSKNIIIEDNIVYDNFAVNIYLATVEGVTIQRNLVYNTNSSPFLRGGDPAGGIVFATEVPDTGAYSSNQVVINNIVAGNSQNIAWWGEGISGALINTLIANNTLINATVNSGTATSLFIDSTALHNNVRITNNIVLQNTPGTIANVPNDSAFTFSNNLWSKTPEVDARGPGDIIADPKLVNTNAALTPGGVNPGWYKLTSISPAINTAVKLSEVYNDFFSSSRGNNPDIGAHEFDGIPQLTISPTISIPYSPTAIFSPTSYPTSPPGENVLLNPSFELGTSDWSFHTDGNGEFSVSSDSYKGINSGYITISQEGTNVQLNQTSIPIEPDTKYFLSFAAKSSSGNNMEVKLHQHESPYTNYGLNTLVDLSSSWQNYSFEFTTSGFSTPTSDTRLRFWFAPYDTSGDEYFIDNVSLIKAGDATPTPTPIPGDGNDDGVVDIQDYGIWIINFGLTDATNPSQGDYNNDGNVDGMDYTVWLTNFTS